MIVDAAAELINYHQGKIQVKKSICLFKCNTSQIMIGGKADRSEPYGAYCANKMYILRAQVISIGLGVT